jgi:ABC-type polysaccharide/polyol phosphate export permease
MTAKTAYDLQAGRGLGGFFSDLAAGLSMVDLWRTFAWDEIQQRYRRSMLGVIWIVIAYAVFVTGVSLFFSGFAGTEPIYFVLYVGIGYTAFTFLSGNIVDGCQVFTGSATWIKSLALPYSVHVYRSLFRSIFTMALQLIVVVPILIYSGWRPTTLTLMILPALAIYLITAVPVQYFFGLLAARFRDVNHLVTSITRLLIFVTPILWMREGLTGLRARVADFNPLTHYIEIFRSPLLGAEPRVSSWIIVLSLTALAWVAAAVTASLMRRRLPYWI